MTNTITADLLFEGSWHALEQAGRLLRGAVRLFDSGEFATSILVGMLAREELGRSLILRELGSGINAGPPPSVADVRKRCEDHVTKQRAGATTFALRIEPGTQLGEAVRTIMKAERGSAEWKAARGVIDTANKAKSKQAPASRHAKRTGAQYVDLDDSGTQWSRPWVIDPIAARNELNDAIDDYAYECDRLCDDVIASDFPGMARARTRMLPTPAPPPPTWPAVVEAG